MHPQHVRSYLVRSLRSQRARQTFRQVTPAYEALAPFDTPLELSRALDGRDPADRHHRDRILHAVLRALRTGIGRELWNTFLVHRFLAALQRIERIHRVHRVHRIHGTVSAAGETPEDARGQLWVVFFEVVAGYPLHRTRSVAGNIVLDTRKRYTLQLRAAGSYTTVVQDVERMTHAASTDPTVRLDLGAVLATSDLQPEDARLLWATEIEGQSVREYARARDLAPRQQAREYDRLRRRKHRIHARLRRLHASRFRAPGR